MAYNLARNSRVFVTTNLNTATGAVKSSGFTTSNTWELQVMDGFSFSQGTSTTNIQINEAGNAPIRGQRAFNTALNPVEISFSTYIRPKNNSSTVGAEEKVLWNALMGSVGIEGTTDGVPNTVVGTTIGGTPATTLVRATTSSPVVTLTGSGMSVLAVGVYNVTGLTGTDATKYNRPVKVNSSTAGSVVFEYLTAPPVAGATVVPNVTASAAVKFTKSAWVDQPTATGITVPYGQVSSALSNKNQLQPIGFIFNVDNAWYTIDNCAMDQASIDFGLDAIATVAWTAKGTKLNTIATPTGVDLSLANPILGTAGSLAGTATGRVLDAAYITNKLSTVSVASTLGGVGSGTTAYTVVLTGGNITVANNINYVTPNNIGVVNVPIGYFTGTRAVSGTMNAYLRTGTGQVADILQNMLANIASSAETKFRVQIEIGGITAGTRVELEMPGVVLGVPSVEIADVVSTAITFNAQGTATDLIGVTSAAYDLENTNDIYIRYFAA
jgi:hypothetical protein